jgi:hypothetical protein
MRKPLLAPPQMMYVAQTLLRACSITTVTRSPALHLKHLRTVDRRTHEKERKFIWISVAI